MLMKQINMGTGRKITTKGTNITRRSRLRKWRHANQKEKVTFLGAVKNIGVTNKGCMEKYWNTKEFSQNTPYFPSICTC